MLAAEQVLVAEPEVVRDTEGSGIMCKSGFGGKYYEEAPFIFSHPGVVGPLEKSLPLFGPVCQFVVPGYRDSCPGFEVARADLPSVPDVGLPSLDLDVVNGRHPSSQPVPAVPLKPPAGVAVACSNWDPPLGAPKLDTFPGFDPK